MKSNKNISARGIINFFLVSLFLFFEMGVQVSPNVIAPNLMHDLNLTSTSLGFMSSIYFYSYAGMMIPVGLLYDRFKIHILLILALGTLAVGNVLFSFATSFAWLAFSRLFMGFGSAFAFVGVLVVARSWFPSRYFALLVGVTQFMAAVGAMMGESPVAYLVNIYGWRHAIILFAWAAIVLLLLVAIFVRPAPCSKKIEGVEASLKHVVTRPQNLLTALYAFSSWGPITIFAALWGGPYMMTRFHINNVEAGLSSVMVWIALALTAPLIGKLVDRGISHRLLMQVTVFIGLLGSAALFYFPGLNYTAVLILSLTIGVGAAGQILSFDMVRVNNAAHEFGLATGFNNIGVVLGGVVLQPLVGILLHINNGSKSEEHGAQHLYSIASYDSAMWLVPACFLMGLLISRYLLKYRSRQVGQVA